MRKLTKKLLIFLLLFLFGVCGFITTAYGEQGVSTKGQITLVQEESSESTVESSTSTPLIIKPQGKYPETGELVRTSLSLSGVVLLLIVFIFYLWKRKKEQEEEQ